MTAFLLKHKGRYRPPATTYALEAEQLGAEAPAGFPSPLPSLRRRKKVAARRCHVALRSSTMCVGCCCSLLQQQQHSTRLSALIGKLPTRAFAAPRWSHVLQARYTVQCTHNLGGTSWSSLLSLAQRKEAGGGRQGNCCGGGALSPLPAAGRKGSRVVKKLLKI